MPKSRRALIYASPRVALHPTITVFARAGFQVDVVSGDPKNNTASLVHQFHRVESLDQAIKLVSELVEIQPYDFVVPVDDFCLNETKKGPWPEDTKLRMLPVVGPEHFPHLASKINLSLVLRDQGIPTPDFLIVNAPEELLALVQTLGFPLMLKEDFSFSGQGTFLCRSIEDVKLAATQIKTYPVLCQRFIQGRLISVEALYVKSKLIHFAYSEVIANMEGRQFSVSCARLYPAALSFPKDLSLWLNKLGAALGAHGFLNIGGTLQLESGNLYFFEADARPNAWVLHPSLFGHCFSGALERFYDPDAREPFRLSRGPSQPKVMSIAHRLTSTQLFLNRYAAWECVQLERAPKNFFLRRLKFEIASLIRLRAWRRFRKRPSAEIRRIRGWSS